MNEDQLFQLFDKGFQKIVVVLFVVALLVLIGAVITAVHLISKWW